MPDPTSDARNVDAFLDEQATGPDIYADYIPPRHPQWRDITEWEEPPCPTTSTPTPPG